MKTTLCFLQSVKKIFAKNEHRPLQNGNDSISKEKFLLIKPQIFDRKGFLVRGFNKPPKVQNFGQKDLGKYRKQWDWHLTTTDPTDSC